MREHSDVVDWESSDIMSERMHNTSDEGSAALDLSQVYCADLGVSLRDETVDATHYDDATQVRGCLIGLTHLPPTPPDNVDIQKP